MKRFLLGSKIIVLLIVLSLAACGGSTFLERDQAHSLTDDDFLIQEFPAGNLVETTVRFQPETENVTQLVEMPEPPTYKQEWRQVNRAVQSERFYQGHDGYEEEEILPLQEAGHFDLLIVLDDSSSMLPYQELLQARFQELLSRISNTNWQIAVVTTTSSCLRETSDGQKILSRRDYRRDPQQAQRRFEELMRAGDAGNTFERGILMASRGLVGDCGDPARKWARDSSQKAVLIITDEKNCGSASNEGCQGQEYATADYFLRRAPEDTRVYGLFLFEDNVFECPQSGGYEDMYPTEYMRLVDRTGGFAEEVCQSDYSRVMTQISAHVSNFIKRVFTLKYPPISSSIQLSLGGEPVNEGYRLQGRELYLDFPFEDPDSLLVVQYRHNPVPLKDQFSLAGKVDPATLKVKVNDQVWEAERYRMDPSGTKLRFADLPPPSATIDIYYKRDGELKRSFQTEFPEDLFDFQVRVDGEVEHDYQWDATDQLLRFTPPPADGAAIAAVYSRVSDIDLDFEITGIDSRRIADYWFEDAETGKRFPLDSVLDGNRVEYSLKHYEPGRKLKAVYQLLPEERSDLVTWLLPELVVEDSIQVAVDGSQTSCGDDYQIDGRKLSFHCASAYRQGLRLSFKHFENYRRTFVIDPDGRTIGPWQVWVNGKVVDDFEREDGRLILTADQVRPGGRVKVKALLDR
jgi:hypothetical protein